MPQFLYRGRDHQGKLHVGQRFASTKDELSAHLIKEGIFPISISSGEAKTIRWRTFYDYLRGKRVRHDELMIFLRQVRLLHDAGIPMVSALKQMAMHTRHQAFKDVLSGLVIQLESGQGLAVAMQRYPDIFSSLIVNLVQVGETTGKLSQAFKHLDEYLAFEIQTKKQMKAAFRYPTFVLIAIFAAIIILNIFVIPSFARFYSGFSMELPWQTRLLVSMSEFFVNNWIYLIIAFIFIGIIVVKYIRTP